MKIGKNWTPLQSICASNQDKIIVRGYDLTESLMGSISFSEYTWLLVTGSLPNENQRRLFDATLVAIAEHGLVPSIQAARMTLATAPEALQGAIAAGLLGAGSVILGASEIAGALFRDVRLEMSATGNSVEIASERLLRGLKEQNKPVPGYGHPMHKMGDPRATKLLALAEELGLYGVHCEIGKTIEGLLPEIFGKSLVINVSAAIPCVLLDAGYPILALKGVPILARTAGLIGHLLEEQSRPIGFILADAAAAAIQYDGPAPDGFVAAES